MADGMNAGDMTVASELVGEALAEKPRLLVRKNDLPRTARELGDMLAATGRFFDRGSPTQLVDDKLQGGLVATPLTPGKVVIAAHRVCQPFVVQHTRDGMKEVEITLPDRVAMIYLESNGEWNLPPLHGTTSAPLLGPDGTIRSAEGYDPRTGLWCADVPDIATLVPEQPTELEARTALATLRKTFGSFPFADAERCWCPTLGLDMVDTITPPGLDETSLLAGLLTAVCRPSLQLAPGLLIRGASLSGAGTGKGLLARAVAMIAFGRAPSAFTGGADRKELEKRLAAELMGAAPVLFLDNLNGVALRSDLLASVLTERPTKVRVLALSKMVLLNPSAFVVLTGNGLTLVEDLLRRFLLVEMDAKMEDPETRNFSGDFLREVEARRPELLAATLTIWRWGRQNAEKLSRGAPLGSYPQWCEWVRDPLLTLGCVDPVQRIAAGKADDRRRRETADFFIAWYDRHGSMPIASCDLHEDVRAIADPQGRGRQFLTAHVDRLVGTRIAGLTLTRSKLDGPWSRATYSVKKMELEDGNREVSRDGAGHDCPVVQADTPMPPMPYRSSSADRESRGGWL